MVVRIIIKVFKIINSSIDFKSLIGYDGKCVSQVLSYIPPDIEIIHACELFHYLLTKDKINKKFKSPSLLFLLLLTHEKNIKDATSRARLENEKAEALYQIVCCNNDQDNLILYQKGLTNEDRIALSKNAIHSMEWLS
ncbi:hypothetical protein [Stygiolobus caldivivus]|uniref:Uncharacterized protein n=1 Tax=Stygiolobus caldivivus TaxID=2824673 RepID=A0A8D5U6K1_9CREN|nr:hypothetical protein [Stygiolobus caldivivus]BCU70585.1 hypothetical protein KN1_18820 [Stygiolobus caldivivus]